MWRLLVLLVRLPVALFACIWALAAFLLFFALHDVFLFLLALVVTPFIAIYHIARNDRDGLREVFKFLRQILSFPFARLYGELSEILSWSISDDKDSPLPFYWLDEDFDTKGSLFS